jgi:3-isopropylmalate/(R)-2-methylmalate dehydratase small subunit
VTDKTGLGESLFADWRYLPDGSPKPDFILNQPQSQGAQVLLAGDNFGCGSSREHAPWALTGFGFRAVISTSFADIFRNNSLKNGLLPVLVDPETHRKLVEQFSDSPDSTVTVDLEEQVLLLPDNAIIQFPIDAFSKSCLLNGTDELGYLLGMEAQISAYEQLNAAK